MKIIEKEKKDAGQRGRIFMAMKDEKAPATLQVVILDGNGKEWARMFANQKDFKTGSKGYYANGKINNPDNPAARYQCGLTFTLIGSKE